MPTPPSFRFDPRTGRYRKVRGKALTEKEVRAVLDSVIDHASGRIRRLAGQLQRGSIDPISWEIAMRREIKNLHLSSSALAKGGWKQMDAATYGRTGPILKKQYQYLRNWSHQLRNSQAAFESEGLGSRAELYAEAARGTYHTVLGREQDKRGMNEERNMLGSADHCDECRAESSRGWVPIGTLSRPGMRRCRARCRCYIIYRKRRSAEE